MESVVRPSPPELLMLFQGTPESRFGSRSKPKSEMEARDPRNAESELNLPSAKSYRAMRMVGSKLHAYEPVNYRLNSGSAGEIVSHSPSKTSFRSAKLSFFSLGSLF